MKGTGRTFEQCDRYVEKYGEPKRWKNQTKHLWKEPTEDMVRNALEKIDPNSAQGIDGDPAHVYQRYPEMFIPRIVEKIEQLEHHGTWASDGSRG